MRDFDKLLRQMTLQEKVSMLTGADLWHTKSVERLGIPALKVSDGPNGARGAGGFTDSVKAACFPVGISLVAFRQRLIEGQMDRRLVERTIEVASQSQTFGPRALRAALDSSPLWGQDEWKTHGIWWDMRSKRLCM